MKNKINLFKFSIFLGLQIFSSIAFSQAPEKMSYQSVLRGTNNALVTNQNVRVKISLLQGNITGSAAYVEEHNTSTNANGLVSLSIGGGTLISGSFSGIDWANGPYFVKMEADPTGGANYTISGTTQLLSVPYALYAKTSGSSQDAWNSTGNLGTNPTTNFIGTTDAKDVVFKTNNSERMRLTSAGNVGIGTTTPTDKLMIRSNDGLSLSFKVAESVNYAELQTNKSGGSHLILQKSGGFVGVGTYAPDRTLSIESAQFNPLRLKSITDGCYVEFFNPSYYSSGQRAGWLGYSSATSKSFDITNQISSGSIKLRTNNLDRVIVDSIGNVGISTNLPTAKLHISGGGIKLDGNTFAGIGFAGADPSETTTGLSDNAKIYMDSGADLYGGSSANDALIIEKCDGNTTPGDGGIILANRGSNGVRRTDFVLRADGKIGIGTNSPVGKFHVNNDVNGADSSMVLTTQGLLGIGTSSPQRALHVESWSNPMRLKSTNDGCYIELFTPAYLSSGSRAGWFGYGGLTTKDFFITNQIPLGAIKFRTTNSDRMIIDSLGNVGIGTIAPNAKLEINGSAIIDNGTGTIRFHSNSTANYIQSGLSLTNGSTKDLFFGSIYGSGSYFTIKSNGNVGVGTTSPNAKLDVNGTVKITDGTEGAGKVLTSDASGNASWQTATTSGAGFTNMQVFSTAGTSSFTVPAGVTKIMVEVWGAGGGGAGTNSGYAAGGGGGAYGKQFITVTPGTAYSVVVGTGGAAGTAGVAGGNGGLSSFGTGPLISSGGGAGGQPTGTGGAGGTSTAAFNISGENGRYGYNTSDAYGGAAPNGGHGGLHGVSSAGGAGNAPGGGGGGAGYAAGSYAGGAGAVGRVVIWY